MGKLTDDGHTVVFKRDEALVLRDGTPVLTVPRINDLYQHSERGEVALCSNSVSADDMHAWLGNPGRDKTKAIAQMHPQLKIQPVSDCETCILANQHRQPYQSTGNTFAAPLELIHVDLCDGRGRAFDGSNYYLILVDNCTKYIQTVPLKNKTTAATLHAFRLFKSALERQTGFVFKKVRSDNGHEFLGEFDEYLQEIGIQHQFTVPYAHQQNGNAERNIQTISSKMKVLLQGGCVPEKYWPSCSWHCNVLSQCSQCLGSQKHLTFQTAISKS